MKILKDGKEMYKGQKILFECDRCECMFTVAKKICGYCEGKSVYACPNCQKILRSDFELNFENVKVVSKGDCINIMLKNQLPE